MELFSILMELFSILIVLIWIMALLTMAVNRLGTIIAWLQSIAKEE